MAALPLAVVAMVACRWRSTSHSARRRRGRWRRCMRSAAGRRSPPPPAPLVMLRSRVRAWPRARVVARTALVAAVAASIAAAWFARQNVFEWMFNPLPRPAFVPARDASFLEPGDLVLAVTSATMPPRIRSGRWRTITWSTIGSAARRRSSPIERSAIPAWSGARRRRPRADVSPGRHQQPELRDAGRGNRHAGGSRSQGRRSSARSKASS